MSSQLTFESLAGDHSHHSRAMERQKNLVQSKITQPPERGIGRTEITKLPEKEFKIKVIIMLMELQKNIQELRDELRRETDTLKNALPEMKHTMEVFKSRLDEVEETVNGIENRTVIQRS